MKTFQNEFDKPIYVHITYRYRTYIQTPLCHLSHRLLIFKTIYICLDYFLLYNGERGLLDIWR